MTSYYAYDRSLPCQNPSCKSHGKPHPNCQCYGGVAGPEKMADGGEVGGYCSANRVHHKLCKYYAAGGSVGPFQMPEHSDPELSVSSYLSHSGLHGLLDIGKDSDDQSIHHYNQDIKRGHKKINSKVGRLFRDSPMEHVDTEKGKKSIEAWLDKGGITHDIKQELSAQGGPQIMADGGEVVRREGVGHDHHLANIYPTQNMMLQEAKGRMSNYLSGLKPQKHPMKLAFDDEPDTKHQHKSYHKALEIAANPLSVLDKIKDGTIEAEHVGHFKNMYPEMDQALQKKITTEISKAQLAKEKPHFKVRQGLSLLLGTPLSGELSQQNIMAAQAVFQNQKVQKQAGQPSQKNMSSLQKASTSLLTADQAAASRQQKQ